MSMVYIPVIRGFSEIAHLWEIAKNTNSSICGGYPRYMCSPTHSPAIPGDVDIFPGNNEGFEQAKSLLLTLDYGIKHENDMAITFSNPEKGLHSFHPTPQLIKPIESGKINTTGDLETILNNFDFTVVRIAIVSPIQCVADPDFYADETKKQLVFKNIHCPVSSLLRAVKYSKKGYWLSPKESLKLFKDWDIRDDDYKNRLIELFETSESATEENKMTQKEIDELEALLRVD